MKIVIEKETDSDKVVKAVMISKTGRFLIMRVSENEKYIGQWDLPGGHLIVGEDPISGLVREVYEETSLFLKDVTNRDLFMISDVSYYKVELPAGQVKLSSEHDKYRFIKLSEMDDYKISEKFQKAIRRAFKFKPRS
jgi:8-oxo-dGTP diphosphatase